MIDRLARKRYGELLRHFASARLTNRDYDGKASELCDRTDDPAIDAVYFAIWGLYDDTYRHRLKGPKRLPREARRVVARCVLFLQTDREYEEVCRPRRPLLRRILSWWTEGVLAEDLAVLKAVDFHEWRQQNVWPFAGRQDLRVVAGKPKLLAGARHRN